MNALPLSRKAMRAALAALLVALGLTVSARAAEPVKGEVNIQTDGGYTRLVFRFDEEVEAKVSISGAIMVIGFNKPVNVPVDRINGSAPDVISAARRDPDGTAIRIALARKVKFNVMPAAERVFVDLLPETWTGVMPGLPQSVVDELARRAREAERQLHQQNLTSKQKATPTIRVKVARQPTFTRYIFEMPDTANVVPDRSDGKLVLNFDQQIKWDLADAKATLPPTLESIEAEADFASVAVIFTLNGAPEVRNFREDSSIVVDVGLDGAKGKVAAAASPAASKVATAPATGPAIEPPETVPAKDAAAADQPPKPAPQAAAAATPPEPASAPLAAKALVDFLGPPSPVVTAPSAPPVAVIAPPRPAPNPDAPVVVAVNRSGDNLRVEFPFAVPTPAAVFRRADMLWLVFDSAAKLDLSALKTDSNLIREVTFQRGQDGEGIVRIRLHRPRLASLDTDGPGWIVNIADTVAVPTRPLGIARSVAGKDRASIAVPFENASKVHRLSDPHMGDRLMVVTALGPTRGFLKSLDFVELRVLPSTHGVVMQPIADDISAELAIDKITIGRPGGLSLSSAAMSNSQAQIAPTFRTMTFDNQLWGFDRQAKFGERQSELIGIAAGAPPAKRRSARLNLARFYLARDLAAEAKAVLDNALADQRGNDDITGSILKAVANVMLDRPDDALKELSNPAVGNQQDAPIWRAVAYARQGKWAEARDSFRNVDAAIGALPIELQRIAMKEVLRASIAVRDFTSAARVVNDFETLGVPPELEATLAVLTGRLNEGLGRSEDALANYRAAAASSDRRAAAQGRLREIVLQFAAGDMPRKDVVHDVETLTTIWRGDETELEGLKLLAHLYTEDGLYREAFHAMRTAMRAHPNSVLTRQIQDEAAVTFDNLFVAGGKSDAMPPVEALGLFYDYRDLTPIGRRGDEMIRRLADRLVGVDLLDQAAELLQHQVDHRLQGAARAQVATRLATIYLMNRKADRALATLQNTRVSDLSNELRDQRLLLESRATSDTGRHDLALELITNIQGHEAVRLRADIMWAAKRWREAAEQIELLMGDRWQQFPPLNDAERTDILRAAIGYTLGEEPIGLTRLREKFTAKMADGPDRRAFDIVSAPIGASGPEFQGVANKISNVDTLDAFLRDMRARYAETPTVVAPAKAPGPVSQAGPVKPVAANAPVPPKAPDGAASKADPAPTGSIAKMPKAKPATR